jgi:hypothetical protein
MALYQSRRHQQGDRYKAVTGAFCDGFEVKLGTISKNKVAESK